jgi:alpha-glucosidase
VRTPIPWTGEAGGGFTSGTPWLPLGERNLRANVLAQSADPGSMLALYRALLRLRRAEPALAVGRFEPVAATDCVLAFRRGHDGRELLVALNLRGEPAGSPGLPGGGRVLLSTHPDRSGELVGRALTLRPHEGLVVALEAEAA